MKYIFFLLPFLFSLNSFSQSEIIPEITISGGADYTNQPISAQSDFSHSQTIYYPEQLKFRGTINEIRYFMPFSGTPLTNSNIWIVKIGTTQINEFAPSDFFIDAATLTPVFSGAVSIVGVEVRVMLTTPFYYNGNDNLVIDVEEITPGHTESGLVGFKGTENFGNPPTRSIISITSPQGNTSILRENSFAKMKFLGNLESCILTNGVYVNNISQTTADISILSNPNVPFYRYNVSPANEPVPEIYELTSNTEILLSNLTPATHYTFNIKADCNIVPSDYFRKEFTTDNVPISVPSQISFDGLFNGDYLLTSGQHVNVERSADAAAEGTPYGLKFRGALTTAIASYWNYTSTLWDSNPQFISKSTFLIDLNSNPSNPIFKFNLKQKEDSKLRIKINNTVVSPEYSVSSDDVDFRTITLDLSSYSGSVITLVIENLSRYSGPNNLATSYVDSIILEELFCESPLSFAVETTQNSITIDWESEADEWEMEYVIHDNPQTGDIINITSLPFFVENLDTATAYDIYVRSKCFNLNSPFTKIFATTDPLPITLPYEENFSIGSLNSYIAPRYNEASEITLNEADNETVDLHQREHELIWTGEGNTTEEEAWNENKNFISSITFIVDANSVSSLFMEMSYKLLYFESQKNSWFRILINGNQFGPSLNPSTPASDPFIISVLDLSAFTGALVEVTLQHSGKNPTYDANGPMDAAKIDSVKFVEEFLGVNGFEATNNILVFPNPASHNLMLKNTSLVDEIIIYDTVGKKMKSYKNKELINQMNLDVSYFNNGLYYIMAISKYGNEYIPFLKK